MKKFLLAVVLFTSLGAFSQSSFKVVESQRKRIGGIDFCHIEVFDKKRCDLFFKDMNSEDGNYVSFSFLYADFDGAYNVIINGFETAVTDEIIKVKSNEELVGLKYLKENGQKLVQFIKYKSEDHSSGIAVSKLYSMDEIKTLFNK